MASTISLSTGIYLLQRILVNNQTFTAFFDNGYSDFVVRKSAVDEGILTTTTQAQPNKQQQSITIIQQQSFNHNIIQSEKEVTKS